MENAEVKSNILACTGPKLGQRRRRRRTMDWLKTRISPFQLRGDLMYVISAWVWDRIVCYSRIWAGCSSVCRVWQVSVVSCRCKILATTFTCKSKQRNYCLMIWHSFRLVISRYRRWVCVWFFWTIITKRVKVWKWRLIFLPLLYFLY